MAKRSFHHIRFTGGQIEILDKVISGLLPHEGYSESDSSFLLKELMTIVPLNEAYGEYYIFLRLFENMNTTELMTNRFSKRLTRDILEDTLSYSLRSVIIDPNFNVDLFLRTHESKTFNLKITTELQEALNVSKSIILEKYDDLMDMKISTEDAIGYLIPLRESFKQTAIARHMKALGEILSSGLIYKGREYSGPDGAFEYIRASQVELSQRLSQLSPDRQDGMVVLNDVVAAKRFDAENNTEHIPLFNLGYDPVDSVWTPSTGDIVSLVADEGVGKTTLAVDWVHTALISGVNTIFICGETASADIKAKILGNHIYSKYKGNNVFTPEQIRKPSKIPVNSEEELEMITIKINSEADDLYSNPNYGTLILIQNTNYETIKDTLVRLITRYDIKLICIDHVAALRSDGSYTSSGILGTTKQKIDYLYFAEKELVTEFNVMFLNTVHLRTDVGQRYLDGKKNTVRISAESSAPTKDASMVIWLRIPPKLENQNVVQLAWTKNRTTDKPPEILLNRVSGACYHWYSDAIQGMLTAGGDKISQQRLNDLIGAPVQDIDEDADDEDGLSI